MNKIDVEKGQTLSQDGSITLTCTSCRDRLKGALRRNLLVVLLVVALLLGTVLGVVLHPRRPPYSDQELLYLHFPGEILMNMLNFLILPLIVSSLICGITSLNARALSKIGLRTAVYFVSTTMMAVVLGIILALVIRPGETENDRFQKFSVPELKASDAFFDLFRQLIPNNMMEMTFQKTLTVLKEKKPSETTTMTTTMTPPLSNVTPNVTIKTTTDKPDLVPVLAAVRGMNMLGVIVTSITAGIIINRLGERGLPLKTLFDAVYDVVLVLIHVIIWYSPIGVLFLVTKDIVAIRDFTQVFKQISCFITVMTGLLAHALLFLPACYFAVCRKNPYIYMGSVMQALITAVGTASSAATLPITMRNLYKNAKLDRRIISFVAPVGANLNMDGTAMFEAVAVIFLAQAEGISLNFGHIVIAGLTATVASIGTAAVPQAGLVTMVIVLTAVGVPTSKIGLILPLDWLLDRFRTAVNVLGDAYGAGIVQRLSKPDIQSMDEEAAEESSEFMTSQSAESLEQHKKYFYDVERVSKYSQTVSSPMLKASIRSFEESKSTSYHEESEFIEFSTSHEQQKVVNFAQDSSEDATDASGS